MGGRCFSRCVRGVSALYVCLAVRIEEQARAEPSTCTVVSPVPSVSGLSPYSRSPALVCWNRCVGFVAWQVLSARVLVAA